MDCNKQQQQCNHESAKYLETPKGILVSFSPLCSESSYWNAWSVFSVIYRGSLKALASCLFCMVFAKKKMPLAWGIFYFFFFYLFATLDLKRSPPQSQFLLFLILYSVCCTLNQHTGLFLQCTIKNFLCLLSFVGLVSRGLCCPSDWNKEMVALTCGVKQVVRVGDISQWGPDGPGYPQRIHESVDFEFCK